MGNRVDRSRKRRPGAQKGNLNALRHGAYSRQFKPTSKQGRLVRWVERELVSALGDPRPQETLILKRGGNEGVPMLGTGGGDPPQGRGAVGNIGAALSSLVARTPRGSKNVGVGVPSKAGPGPRLLPRRKVQLDHVLKCQPGRALPKPRLHVFHRLGTDLAPLQVGLPVDTINGMNIEWLP